MYIYSYGDVTDALGNRQATYTNGSGKTVKTEQLSGPDGTITTTFEYDGIDRLVKVTDTEGNTTTSVYDMGDRRIEVNHPASGITSFTYDALGNVVSKQTANLKKDGKSITYDYDYIENEQIKKTGAGDFFSKQEIADIIKFFQKARVFLLSIDSLGNMRIRINKNDCIEYLKVVDSPANHKRIVKKMYGNWYIAEAMHF
ncbi:hypothetical protein [Leyella lascolaii]|uniref:RHS repeat protein n=1 Tax=Leyella lascolaii TaxID=1776379 RepID=A0AAW7JP94_9BACT|nr:hypothetical protein [Leyella lascolaii]MDN0021922.1 hypothetical protein [Leyella lascolaii]MDN0024685.1 hypothetical protein [Leyella lascolaii]